MKKQINICDWCGTRRAIALVTNGEHKDDCLCLDCVPFFLEVIGDICLSELDRNGWSLSDYNVVLKKIEEKNEA